MRVIMTSRWPQFISEEVYFKEWTSWVTFIGVHLIKYGLDLKRTAVAGNMVTNACKPETNWNAGNLLHDDCEITGMWVMVKI